MAASVWFVASGLRLLAAPDAGFRQYLAPAFRDSRLNRDPLRAPWHWGPRRPHRRTSSRSAPSPVTAGRKLYKTWVRGFYHSTSSTANTFMPPWFGEASIG